MHPLAPARALAEIGEIADRFRRGGIAIVGIAATEPDDSAPHFGRNPSESRLRKDDVGVRVRAKTGDWWPVGISHFSDRPWIQKRWLRHSIDRTQHLPWRQRSAQELDTKDVPSGRVSKWD